MRIKTIFIFTFILCGIVYCTCLEGQQVQKIYINPSNPATHKQSDFVDSIRMIPFQPAEGLNMEGDVVRQTDDYYIITNYGSGSIYFYSKAGVFIRKINYKPVVGNLYPAYDSKANQVVFFGNNNNYTLTPKDKIKILLDWNNKRNLKYYRKYVINLNDTDFVIRKSRPNKFDLTGAVHVFPHRYIQTSISTGPLYTDSIGYEVSIYDDEALLKTYFPYDRIHTPAFQFSEERASVIPAGIPDEAYITRPYRDTIYQLVKDSIYPVYQLVFPIENSLSSSFFLKPAKTKTEKENFSRNNGRVFHQVYGFYETPRLVYIGINFFSRIDAFLYDKQTQVAYNMSKIKPDATQYNLTLLSPFMQTTGNWFFQLVNADKLVSFFKEHSGTPIPAEIASFLKTNPIKNTPVLVEYKLKDK